MQDPQNVEFRELATLRINSPKPGRQYQGPFKGEPQLVATGPKDVVLKFADLLRRVPVRGDTKGLRVYLDEEELQLEGADGSSLFEENDFATATPAATLTGETALAAGQRVELQRLDRQLEQANAALKDAKERVRKAEADAETRIAAAEARAFERIKKAQEHADEQIETAYIRDKGAQTFRMESLQELQASMVVIHETRQRADQMMTAETWGAVAKSLKEGWDSLLESNIGRALGLQASSMLSAFTMKHAGVKKEDGAEYTAADALAAMVQQGKVYNERVQLLHRIAGNYPTSPIANAAVMGLRFVHSEVEPKALQEMIIAYAAEQTAAGGGA